MMQLEMVSLESLVPLKHPYRAFNELLDFDEVSQCLSDIDTRGQQGPNGYGINVLFRCLLLQFMEDLSDRELERFLSENVSGKWFCGFSLSCRTPDYTVFSRTRAKIGTKRLSSIFSVLRNKLKEKGYLSEVFTFVDATHLISKANLWKERDKAAAVKIEKLNNETLPKVAYDKDARIGCKRKNHYWYGYKQHTSVDMQSGMINKVAVTPANVTDAQGLTHVCPKSEGAVVGDKGYCTKDATQAIRRHGGHPATVKRNNMKDKNVELDRFYTKLRAPYERVFSKLPKRTRYRGIAKNQFSAFLHAICFNLKRELVLRAAT